MATIFKLIIEDDEGKTTVYPLADGSVSIGRKESNTIRLMERNVSRRHARLVRSTAAVFIEDLDSYNGIRINGERIAGRYEVKEGDLVEIGDYHLALQRSEVAEDELPTGEAPHGRGDGWPPAGTVPDIRLPNEMVASGNARDTVIDQEAPPNLPSPSGPGALDQPLPPSQPLVKPPPRGDTGGAGSAPLPPFPGPGGLAPPKAPMYGEASQATEAIGGSAPLAAGPAYQSTVPRLVCVSTTYAGKEFALTRPELIIGRVEDNDIVIEHRSVSRNHAKILFDGSTHKIIDLQSANGILVNGEEYAMTDLRKGDLVELGHVRFRFIPADEPFLANEEETKEMREAGVEAPSAPKNRPSNADAAAGLTAPPAPAPAANEAPLPAYDPSTAQTVTDTPLDALGMGDLAAPHVQASAPPAAKPPRPSRDQRPTQVNAAPPANTRPSAAAFTATVPDDSGRTEAPPRAQTRTESEVEAAPEAAPKKGLLIIIAALLLMALVLGFLVISGGGSAERQETLQKAFEAKDWNTVVRLYEEDPSDFANPKAVLPLYKKAVAAQASGGTPAARPEPDVEPPLGDTPDPDPEPLEPVREPEPEPDLPDGDANARTEAARTKASKRRAASRRRSKTAKSTKSTNAAAQLASDGSRALMQGDLTSAERLLTRCLKADPGFANCHRTLGVLYAQRDDTQRSIRHYRKYVQLAPTAADAERVRQMIRKAEAASEEPSGENAL